MRFAEPSRETAASPHPSEASSSHVRHRRPPDATLEAVRARPTKESDLAFVMEAERNPDNSEFVLQWTRHQHMAVMADLGAEHWIIEDAAKREPIGFVIFRSDAEHSSSVEFKRLVICEKGAGYGRAAIRLVKRAVFERHGAHRLWLDVFDFNHRARRLYESEGFVVEGTRREPLRRGDRYVSLVLMSMLEHEYRNER